MYKINSNSDLTKIAQNITCDSELYGDEVISVVGQLTDILNNANKFGMVYSDTVNDMWGNTIKVVAYPSYRRSEWTF